MFALQQIHGKELKFQHGNRKFLIFESKMELVMTIIFGFFGAVLSILLAVIGYFLSEFKKSVDNMSSSVNKLEVTAATYSEKFAANDEKNEVITTRLNCHSDKINDHEKRLIKLEK
jgi:hypothetical protein